MQDTDVAPAGCPYRVLLIAQIFERVGEPAACSAGVKLCHIDIDPTTCGGIAKRLP